VIAERREPEQEVLEPPASAAETAGSPRRLRQPRGARERGEIVLREERPGARGRDDRVTISAIARPTLEARAGRRSGSPGRRDAGRRGAAGSWAWAPEGGAAALDGMRGGALGPRGRRGGPGMRGGVRRLERSQALGRLRAGPGRHDPPRTTSRDRARARTARRSRRGREQHEARSMPRGRPGLPPRSRVVVEVAGRTLLDDNARPKTTTPPRSRCRTSASASRAR